MKTIELNETNCKEYTTEELESKLDSLEPKANWDAWLSMSEEELKESENKWEKEIEEEAIKEYNENYEKNVSKLPTKPCPKCGGTGKIHAYNHVSGGICFKCDGYGKI